jgi:hypothetical protein
MARLLAYFGVIRTVNSEIISDTDFGLWGYAVNSCDFS